MGDPRSQLQWTDWRPLQGAGRDRSLPRSPGLYRIRRVGRDDVDYIGQTGMHLGQRLALLKGIYKDAMPFADPHTAGPALWALRHATNCDFEVSVTPIEGSTPWRRGMEAVAIAVYRQEHGRSPTIEFGRMPVGYHPSSMSNSRLADTGRRFRGGPASAPHQRHRPGIAPVGPLAGDPRGPTWGGHNWTPWLPLHELAIRAARPGSGLYRIRGDALDALLYIGQGRIPSRPREHSRKVSMADHEQGRIFASQQRLECSWVINDEWLSHHRLELENDLIAAHMLQSGKLPTAQFLG